MKKLLSTIVCLILAISCIGFASCKTEESKKGNNELVLPKVPSEYKIAMITDYGDITDQSFNQTTYEACLAFTNAKQLSFKYYKPAGDSTEARVASVNQAINEKYNVIVMPGYAFGGTIIECAANNPDVYFIALDVSAGDLGADYVVPGNVTTFVYHEELAGYMAGYAAVKEGYRKLGFLGGMAVPAVIRFGYGYIQGANAAAVEMNIINDVSMKYVYGGQFYGDASITARMDSWYSAGTEVVFACGGGIYTSACEAAVKTNGKVIGVDSDQSHVINAYSSDYTVCLTSAMKGLAPTVETVLTDLVAGKWANYAGKISNMGINSATDASKNYVQLPTETWAMTRFTQDDYMTVVRQLYYNTVAVSSDSGETLPATAINVTVEANIK